MPDGVSLVGLLVRCNDLTLRTPVVDDLEAFMAVYSDDFDLTPQPRPVNDPDRVRAGMLRRIQQAGRPGRHGQWRADLIVETEPSTVIGWAMLEQDLDQPPGTLETSSWVAPPFRRRGYATTIRNGVLVLAFSGLNADAVLSRAQPSNTGSNRISHSLGYARGPTTWTEGRPRVAYTNWTMTRHAWKCRPQPVHAEMQGHEAFRDWLTST